ncbi:hypothetical protein R6Q59_011350 [Mikania micrantha]
MGWCGPIYRKSTQFRSTGTKIELELKRGLLNNPIGAWGLGNNLQSLLFHPFLASVMVLFNGGAVNKPSRRACSRVMVHCRSGGSPTLESPAMDSRRAKITGGKRFYALDCVCILRDY